MSKLRAAVESMDAVTQATKTPLQQLREWRLQATLRFTGKSISLAKKGGRK